tara:strand:- start:58146 stop:58862 length:717 start_codon:yes stop_codon:yes gene_type:complete
MNVLVICEKSLISNVLINELKNKKYDITICSDGLKAFNFLILYNYDLVISSTQLENLDGFQLLAAIRSSHTLNSLTPFIMLTSVVSFDNFARLESRPDFILMKNENLIEELNEILKKISANSTTYKILFIEDDKFTQTIINTWFKKINEIEFDIISSVSEFKEVNQDDYDLIVSDNNITDGTVANIFELVDTLPVIIYTASFSSVKLDTNDYPNLVGIKEKPYDTNYIGKMLAKYCSK